jgi:hypothetical protein
MPKHALRNASRLHLIYPNLLGPGINQFLHADGESLVTKNEMLSISVRANSLKVIV